MRIKLYFLCIFMGIALLATSCSEIRIIEEEQEAIVEEHIVDEISEIEKIEIDASITDVEVQRTDEDLIRINLETYEKGPRLNVDTGKVLRIESKRKDSGAVISIGFRKSPKLKISVPKSYENSYEVDLSTGDFKSEDILADVFESDSSTGDIDISKLKAKKVEFESSTGDVEIDSISAENISIESSTGDIRLNKVEGNIIGESSTGDVNISYLKYDYDLEYTVSTSDLNIELNNDSPNFTIDAKASVGEVDCDIVLSEIIELEDDSIKGISGNGENKLKLKASVGDIEIK